jgi:enoyl-CoA hydratase
MAPPPQHDASETDPPSPYGDVLLLDVADGVAVLTMHRPEARNALNAALRAAVPTALAELDAREDVRAIILTGTDPAFTAGIDLKELSTSDEAAAAALPGALGNGPFPLMRTPLIGAVNGPAVTGGFEYALACDFLIASERARFADTHGRVGIMPGWGLTVHLVRSVGVRRARQLSFTGDYLDANTALAWGLVNEVVAHEQLLPRCREIGRSIAQLDPEAVGNLRETYRLITADAEAWAIEGRRSNEWMAERFDRERLAADRAAIQERGRNQI